MDMLTCTRTGHVQKRMDPRTHGRGRTSAHPPDCSKRRGGTLASCGAPARVCPAPAISVPAFPPNAVSIPFLTSPSVPVDPQFDPLPCSSPGFRGRAGDGAVAAAASRRRGWAMPGRVGLGASGVRPWSVARVTRPEQERSSAPVLGALPPRMLLPRSAPAPARALRQL